MAWIWWLLTPGIIVAAGTILLGRRERRALLQSQRDPIGAHQALLDALAQAEISTAAARGQGRSSKAG